VMSTPSARHPRAVRLVFLIFRFEGFGRPVGDVRVSEVRKELRPPKV
jgi:hypothetical protein